MMLDLDAPDLAERLRGLGYATLERLHEALPPLAGAWEPTEMRRGVVTAYARPLVGADRACAVVRRKRSEWTARVGGLYLDAEDDAPGFWRSAAEAMHAADCALAGHGFVLEEP